MLTNCSPPPGLLSRGHFSSSRAPIPIAPPQISQSAPFAPGKACSPSSCSPASHPFAYNRPPLIALAPTCPRTYYSHSHATPNPLYFIPPPRPFLCRCLLTIAQPFHLSPQQRQAPRRNPLPSPALDPTSPQTLCNARTPPPPPATARHDRRERALPYLLPRVPLPSHPRTRASPRA